MFLGSFKCSVIQSFGVNEVKLIVYKYEIHVPLIFFVDPYYSHYSCDCNETRQSQSQDSSKCMDCFMSGVEHGKTREDEISCIRKIQHRVLRIRCSTNFISSLERTDSKPQRSLFSNKRRVHIHFTTHFYHFRCKSELIFFKCSAVKVVRIV